MLWLLLAVLAAVFTSLTTIFAKIGIKNVNSNFATAYRTLIVIVFAILICAIKNELNSFSLLTSKNIIFLVLSGLMTGLSWLCYYKALKLGDVNKVVPIDKCSFILTSILFLIFFFNDTTKGGNVWSIIALIVSMVLMAFGTVLMIVPKQGTETKNKVWLLFAILSALFASLVSLFVKIGLNGIPSNFGTVIRTIIVFLFASTIVLFNKDYKDIRSIDSKSWIFLSLSGISTGGAWLCEYGALNMSLANPVAVNAIGKFSILITMLFSLFILKEKMKLKEFIGLLLLTLGIVVILIFSL